jgi:hypothetical protein
VSACVVVKGKLATMKDRIRPKMIRLRLRINNGGPPLFEIWMGELCHKELAAKRYKKHKLRLMRDFVAFILLVTKVFRLVRWRVDKKRGC